MHLILFGPPGSGKGTQAQALEKRYHLDHLSTGALFRTHITKKTALGKLAQSYIDKGKYVPDKVTIGMVESFMTAHKGILFDGFPRTVPQAKALEKMALAMRQPISGVVFLDVPDEEVIKRIILRGKKGSGRSDDNEVTARKRLKEYYQKTHALHAFYKKKGLLIHVDGFQPIRSVTAQIAKKIAHLEFRKKR